MRYLHPTLLSLALVCETPALAGKPIGAESAIAEYCEPLISGSAATTVKAAARRDGFKDDIVGQQPILRLGTLMMGISDSPRVCMVQAPSEMTFDQGIALVDGWAARHPGAVRSPTTRGPDGAPVRAWTSPAHKRSLIVSQQTNPLKQKVLAFILMPMPPAQSR